VSDNDFSGTAVTMAVTVKKSSA